MKNAIQKILKSYNRIHKEKYIRMQTKYFNYTFCYFLINKEITEKFNSF